MINVVRLEPHSQWDQNILNRLFQNQLLPTGLTFSDHERYLGKLTPEPELGGCILIIPGRYWHDRTDEINEYIQHLRWVLAIRTGDEQDLLDIDKVRHPNIRWWVQTPRIDHTYGDVRKFGVGYTPHFNIPQHSPPDMTNDVFLSAQNTHPRRFDAFASTNCMPGMQVLTHQTPGFTQGLAPELYTQYMIHSKVALAPAGPDTPDTFRLYEALQAHTVPIADDIAANRPDVSGYWEMVFPDAPFPILTNWFDAPGIVKEAVANYPRNANRIAAWWMREKRNYVHWLNEDLELLTAGINWQKDASVITVVIPVSPIPGFPDISILEETLNSVRWHLPDSEIILTFDGVRAEQEDMRDAYEEAIRRILWRCDHYWNNVTPIVFDQHMHQSGMMRVAMNRIHTPLLLYVEQDTPIVIDQPIDWSTIISFIDSERADLVRLHHEASILDVHMHLMQDKEGVFWRTTQWSQRPHVASLRFYRNCMEHFSLEAKCFIEERLAGPAQQQHYWKLFVYTPDTPDIKRSYHLDGRCGGPKFEDSQVF